LASVCQGKVNVWRLDGLAPGATRSFPLPPDPVRNIFRISVGEGNTRLLLWGAKSVYLYDLTAVNPAPQAVVFSGRGDLEQVNFVDNGRFIVTLHVDHTNISHWCNYGIRRRYAHTAHLTVPHLAGIVSVSPDERLVAIDEQTVPPNKRAIVVVYDLISGTPIRRFDGLERFSQQPAAAQTQRVWFIDFSLDSARLVYSSNSPPRSWLISPPEPRRSSARTSASTSTLRVLGSSPATSTSTTR
jgi:hypothetical protein